MSKKKQKCITKKTSSAPYKTKKWGNYVKSLSRADLERAYTEECILRHMNAQRLSVLLDMIDGLSRNMMEEIDKSLFGM